MIDRVFRKLNIIAGIIAFHFLVTVNADTSNNVSTTITVDAKDGSDVNVASGGSTITINQGTTTINNVDKIILDDRDFDQLIRERDQFKEKIAQATIELEKNPDSIYASNNLIEAEKKLVKITKEIDKFKSYLNILLLKTEKIKSKSNDEFEKLLALSNQGKLQKARKLINIDSLDREQQELLSNRSDIDEKLKESANKYLVVAGLTSADISNPNRIANSIKYYEKALQSNHSIDILNAYANFLVRESKLDKKYLDKAISLVQISGDIIFNRIDELTNVDLHENLAKLSLLEVDHKNVGILLRATNNNLDFLMGSWLDLDFQSDQEFITLVEQGSELIKILNFIELRVILRGWGVK